MKLTPAKRAWIAGEMERLGRLAGIVPEAVQLLLTRKEHDDFKAAKRAADPKWRGRSSGAYGVAYQSRHAGQPTIYLNVKSHHDLPGLRDTIAHELCHLRYPYMGHTDRFRRVIARLLAGEHLGNYQPKKKPETHEKASQA